jgi:hypothetical protein
MVDDRVGQREPINSVPHTLQRKQGPSGLTPPYGRKGVPTLGAAGSGPQCLCSLYFTYNYL